MPAYQYEAKASLVARACGHPGRQDDGLDSLDMLGGWEGSASRRGRKR